MKLSIIIPAYNVEKYLSQCLESCYRQDIPENDYEVIVINDGSKDRTLEIALQWESIHDNLKVISQENKGLSQARNKGLEAAVGDFIMFLDSDDWIVDNCLKSLTDNCLDNKLDMLRFCAARVLEKPYRRFSYHGYDQITSGRDLLGTRFPVCVPFAIYRKDFLAAHSLSFYPGIYHEDNEFTPRAYYYAERVGSTDNIIYMVRQTPGSITHSVNPKKVTDLIKVSEMLKYFADTEAEEQYRAAICRQSADCMNSCFRELNKMSKADSERLYPDIYNRRKEITGYFLQSDSLKHRLEGMALLMFPKRMLCVYRIMDMVHYRERRRQNITI